MRVLRFIVNKQIIEYAPDCNFDDIVPGTEGYLQASFSFSPEWDNHLKVAAFYSMLGAEYAPARLEDGKTCMIPSEALKKRKFKMRILGIDEGGKKLVTNKITITQNGG